MLHSTCALEQYKDTGNRELLSCARLVFIDRKGELLFLPSFVHNVQFLMCYFTVSGCWKMASPQGILLRVLTYQDYTSTAVATAWQIKYVNGIEVLFVVCSCFVHIVISASQRAVSKPDSQQ